MEPDVTPFHSSSPPPLDDDDGGGGASSEEDEFGDFGGFSLDSAPGLRQPPPATKIKASCRQVKQTQPPSAMDVEAGSRPHLTNGYHRPDTRAAGVRSPTEQTGFADFSVFAEQAAHPWCCGFSPMGGAEQWDSRAAAASSRSQQGVMDSEPRPHCASTAEEKDGTTGEHCERADAAGVLPSQDSLRDQRRRLESTHMQEDAGEHDEKNVSAAPRTSAPEELASRRHHPSDLQTNVSSVASEGRTDDDDGHHRRSQAEKDFHHCDQPATQETSATSNQSQPGTRTSDSFADFQHCSSDDNSVRGLVRSADSGLQSLGNLPPSDSFADFCSAPPQEDGEGVWVEGGDGARTWTGFRERVSSRQTDGSTQEEEEEEEGRDGQASLSDRVQQLLLASFPQVPAVEGEEEVVDLRALLQRDEDEEEEEEEEASHRVRSGAWWPHQDLRRALGLQFQWGGSHTNRTLLRCLGMDTTNIVFMGVKKQPVVVPAFASNLGMLEPTKDSVCSPGRSAVTAQAPPGPRDTPHHPALSHQEALPSSRLDWSSRGLSSSQDGTSPRRTPHFWGRK